jgi:hypothetical protein
MNEKNNNVVLQRYYQNLKEENDNLRNRIPNQSESEIHSMEGGLHEPSGVFDVIEEDEREVTGYEPLLELLSQSADFLQINKTLQNVSFYKTNYRRISTSDSKAMDNNEAATIIQKHYRGFITRRKFSKQSIHSRFYLSKERGK